MSRNSRKFCKECNTYLKPFEIEGKLFIQCDKCGYNEPAEGLVISYYSHKKNKKDETNISPNLIYDYTFPRTKKIKCVNSECKANKPEIVIITSEKRLKTNYICVSCKTVWG